MNKLQKAKDYLELIIDNASNETWYEYSAAMLALSDLNKHIERLESDELREKVADAIADYENNNQPSYFIYKAQAAINIIKESK